MQQIAPFYLRIDFPSQFSKTVPSAANDFASVSRSTWLKANFYFPPQEGPDEWPVVPACECRLLVTDGGFQRCLTGTRLYCSETTVKDGWRASFSAVRVYPVRNTAGHHDRCGPDRSGWVVHCHLCDGGKNLRTVTDGIPGVSTQPLSSFSAVNGESAKAGRPVQPAPAQQPSSHLH